MIAEAEAGLGLAAAVAIAGRRIVARASAVSGYEGIVMEEICVALAVTADGAVVASGALVTLALGFTGTVTGMEISGLKEGGGRFGSGVMATDANFWTGEVAVVGERLEG
jgi:hypothetical protein